MSASLQISAVRLRVPNVARSVDFYVRRLGFVAVAENGPEALLATQPGGTPLLTLVEDRSAATPPRDTAGLFHAALLLPGRAELGAWLQFSAAQSVDFEGFSDHGVSEAIYLSDPDGNGLEVYADRPRSDWPFAAGELAMTTRPLHVRRLLDEAAPATDTPLAGARWGHLHLRVTDLDRSEAFYRQALGVDVTQRSFPGARFLATDGYHHHLGLNTWGTPRLPQPAGALGLAGATFTRPGTASATTFVDPDGIPLHLAPALVPA